MLIKLEGKNHLKQHHQNFAAKRDVEDCITRTNRAITDKFESSRRGTNCGWGNGTWRWRGNPDATAAFPFDGRVRCDWRMLSRGWERRQRRIEDEACVLNLPLLYDSIDSHDAFLLLALCLWFKWSRHFHIAFGSRFAWSVPNIYTIFFHYFLLQ